MCPSPTAASRSPARSTGRRGNSLRAIAEKAGVSEKQVRLDLERAETATDAGAQCCAPASPRLIQGDDGKTPTAGAAVSWDTPAPEWHCRRGPSRAAPGRLPRALYSTPT